MSCVQLSPRCGVVASYCETVEQVQELRRAVKLKPLQGELLARGSPLCRRRARPCCPACRAPATVADPTGGRCVLCARARFDSNGGALVRSWP